MFKPPNITQLFRASISGDGGGGLQLKHGLHLLVKAEELVPNLGVLQGG
jgi:hypothetical protein